MRSIVRPAAASAADLPDARRLFGERFEVQSMVKIRLSRAGAKKHPYYHIIAIDERKRRDGRPLERLGTYEPGRSDAPLTLDLDGIDRWVGLGAQLSETVASLVKKGRKAAAAAPAAEGASA